MPKGAGAGVQDRAVIEQGRNRFVQLDLAQGSRQLTAEEFQFRKRLKARRCLELAQIEKARLKQHSRLTQVRFGDANTKFLQIEANLGRRKNFMQCLQTECGLVFSQEAKSEAIQTDFQ